MKPSAMINTLVFWLTWQDWLRQASDDELSTKRVFLQQQSKDKIVDDAILSTALEFLDEEIAKRQENNVPA